MSNSLIDFLLINIWNVNFYNSVSLQICTYIYIDNIITSMQGQPQQGNSFQTDSKDNQFFPLRMSPFKNSLKHQELIFTSNYYQIQFLKHSTIYQLAVRPKPQISQDNFELWNKLITYIYITYQNELSLLFWDSHSLWSLKNLQQLYKVDWTPSLSGKQQIKSYEVTISLLGNVSLAEKIKDQSKRKSLSKGLNLILKEKLRALDLTQFRKEHFYKIQSLSQDCLTEFQVQILRGFYAEILFLQTHQICLKVFPIDEILQIRSFLQTIKMNKQEKFKNQFVVARYGKFKTYRIQKIQLDMSPLSTFFDSQKHKTISFKDYFAQKYKIQIQFQDQPLVSVSRRNQNKNGKIKGEDKILLIPQLLALIGLTRSQRQDSSIKNTIYHTKDIKNNFKNRLGDIEKFIQTLNSKFADNLEAVQPNIQPTFQLNKDLLFKLGQPIKMKGYQLPPVNLIFGNQKKVTQDNGHFCHRQNLYQKGKLQDWMIFYSSLTLQDQVQNFQSRLKKVSNELGVKVQNSFFYKIQIQTNNNDEESREKLWVQAIEDELQKYAELPQIIVCYFNSKEANFCHRLNKIFVNKYGVQFQNVNSDSFEKKPYAIITSLLISINQKIGFAPWKVDISKLSTIYTPNSFSVACVSYSLYKKGNQYTFGFVGSLQKDSNKIFTFSITGIKGLDELTTQFYQIPFNSWLKWCYSKNSYKNNYLMPKVIVIYRKQVLTVNSQRQLQIQVQALRAVISDKIPKKLNYEPEIIVLNVDQNSSSTFYIQKLDSDIIESKCGNFIAEKMSKHDFYDFHLVSKYQVAKCNIAVGYRIVYRNKFSVSEEDIISFTYGQCFNFCGRFQSSNIPSWMVCSQKLSRFVGKYIGENVRKMRDKAERKQQIVDSYYFL